MTYSGYTAATDDKEGFFYAKNRVTDDTDTSIINDEYVMFKVTGNNATVATHDPDSCDRSIFPIVLASGTTL